MKYVDNVLRIEQYMCMEQKPLRFLSEMVLAPSLNLYEKVCYNVQSQSVDCNGLFLVDTILAIISVDYCLFLWNGGVFVYLVSEAFLQAVQENTRSYYWIGKITTKNGMIYEFGPEQIVKGSGYISSQCRGSSGIEPDSEVSGTESL